jgi:hypothetical protein
MSLPAYRMRGPLPWPIEQIAPSFLRIVGFFDLEPSDARRIVQALSHSPFEVVGADQLEALSSNLAVACQTVISTNNHKL